MEAAGAARVCRVCLEQGALSMSSVWSGNLSMSLADMIRRTTGLALNKDDGLPSRICSNCIYKLSVAYHFKQQCESSDLRLREYLGLRIDPRFKDVAVATDEIQPPVPLNNNSKCKCKPKQTKKTPRYKKKAESEKLKRGPKPKPKQDHACYECSKQFKCRAQLDMHIRTHTGDRPFACVFCSRRFTQKHNLDIHVRVHTGERPYQCDMCSKRFSAQGNLQTHLKIHLGQRDQICSICKKGFITTTELTRHMAKHRGAKDYKCDVCGTAFVQLRDLKSHKRKKHNIGTESASAPQKDYNATQSQSVLAQKTIMKHECTTCGETFQYLTLLAQHCSMKHAPYIDPVDTHL